MSAAYDLDMHDQVIGLSPGYRRVPSTKLVPARLRADAVTRHHLIDLIESDPDRQVVVIEAPAGYGKSTLAAQWIAAAALPVAWLSLDDWDNEPAQFFAGVLAALHQIDPRIGDATGARIDLATRFTDRGIVNSLVDDLSVITAPCAMVLDDFHCITDTGLLEAAAVLLRNLPASMRLLILTRNEPRLPLSRMRLRGTLLEIGYDDLRFSHNEANVLLTRQDQPSMHSKTISMLNERTEGWPAGLSLAGHMMNKQTQERSTVLVERLADRKGPVAEYLWEEVLHSLSPALTTFLEQSAIFDRFTAPLCDDVFGTTSSAKRLRELDAAGLFLIPLDTQGTWYRYHQLFRDILHDRLIESRPRDEIARLHKRAAVWFESHGHVDEAVRHAIAGEDWPRAIRLVEPAVAHYYAADMVSSLRIQLESFPASVLSEHPEFSFLFAWSLARSGYAQASLAPLDAAERAWLASGNQDNLGRIAMMRALISAIMSEFKDSLAHTDRSLSMLPESRSVDRARVLIFRGTVYGFLGKPRDADVAMALAATSTGLEESTSVERLDATTVGAIQVLKGNLQDAVALFRRATRPDQQPTMLPIQHALTHLGMVLVEQNSIEEAEQCFTRGLRLSQEAGTRLWRGRFHAGLAVIARANRDFDSAFSEIDKAIQEWELVGSPHEKRKSLALRARLRIAAGQVSLAGRWADQSGFSSEMQPDSGERQFEYATYLRYLIASGLAKDVVQLGTILHAMAVEDERIGDVIELDLLIALALAQVGDSDASLDRLEAALTSGQPRGFVRTFVDEAELLAPLLRQAIASRPHLRDQARRLLSVIENANESTQDTLSEREAEVLKLAAIGLSNRAIGDRLFISEKTVKKHVSNVLAKLDASNRTEAVSRARELGLFG